MPGMADPYTAQGTEETLSEVVARYEKKGYTAQFSARAEGFVHCHKCGEETAAEQVPLRALHRFEGVSDPDDEAVVAALECPACGAWGTFVATYGPEASPEEQDVMGRFMVDEREHSNIQTGT